MLTWFNFVKFVTLNIFRATLTYQRDNFPTFQATSNTIMLMEKDIERNIVKKFARKSEKSEEFAGKDVSHYTLSLNACWNKIYQELPYY